MNEAYLFAKENLNKLVEVVIAEDDDSISHIYQGTTGIVIGWDKGDSGWVVLAQNNWSGYGFSNGGNTEILAKDISQYTDNPAYTCIRFKPKHLKVVSIVKVNPYPHKCKVCKAPSRKCGSVVLCSNSKCSSRHSFNKKYLLKSSRDPKEIRCPKCEWLTAGHTYYPSMTPSVAKFECYRHHIWQEEIVAGDSYEGEYTTTTFDGHRWSSVPRSR